MKHLACLVAGLVMTKVMAFGLDSTSTLFLCAWAVCFVLCEAGAFLISSEERA